ncbi:MFS general substrate transporter [Meredithblackwellia eburnea MCA 4105]
MKADSAPSVASSTIAHDTPVFTSSNPEDLALAKKTAQQEELDSYLLSGRTLALVFIAMLLSIFLIAIDQTILAVALPQIASQFNSFTLQGWVSSSFVMVQTATILLFVALLRVLPAKLVVLFSITVFEIGSIVSGSAHSIYIVIVGRAISGIGAAGIFVGIIQVMTQATTVEQRPRLFGMFGAVFGLASIIGPLVGGAFTEKVTWRWCFYINVPVGGVSLLGVSLMLKTVPALGSDPNKRSPRALLQEVIRLDWFGALLSCGAIVALSISLQWGGGLRPWSDPAVIACFALFGVLTAAFLAWEIWLGDRALVPLRIFRNLSISLVMVYNSLVRVSMMLLSYYIPLFYQAGRHESVVNSGVKIIPYMLPSVTCVVIGGFVVSKTGRYWPFLIVGPIFSAIGGGLLFTVTEHTSVAKIVGYQILLGVGQGLVFQNALVAVQGEFISEPHLITSATGMGSFMGFFGGTVGLGICEAVLQSELTKNLAKYAASAPAALIKNSPSAIYSLPEALIPSVVKAYVKSLRMVFIICVPLAGTNFLMSIFIKNIHVITTPPPKVADPAGEEEKGAVAEQA